METLANGEDSISQDFSQAKIQLTEFTCRNRLLLSNAKNLFAKRRWKVQRSMSKQLHIELEWNARDASKNHINAVSRRAGHETEDKRGTGIGHTTSFSTETAKCIRKS